MGEYINTGSDHLRNKTWGFVPRSKFAGTEITWENKREVIKDKAREYKEKNPEASAEECIEWGKRFVRREQKHFKSFIKGKNSYSYLGGTYLVEDQTRLEHFIQMAKMFEEKNAEEQLKLINNQNQEEE
jgi:hypothetical protein